MGVRVMSEALSPIVQIYVYSLSHLRLGLGLGLGLYNRPSDLWLRH